MAEPTPIIMTTNTTPATLPHSKINGGFRTPATLPHSKIKRRGKPLRSINDATGFALIKDALGNAYSNDERRLF